MPRVPFVAWLPSGSRLERAARVLRLTLLALALARGAAAQLISVRTVPISQADQFDIFPSQNLGMGGVLVALPDTLLDPFRNPADAARLRSPRIFSSPALYSVSSQSGAGRTLPLGAYLRSHLWFGAFAAALQQVDASQAAGPLTLTAPNLPIGPSTGGVPQINPGARTHGNQFVTLMLGRQTAATGLSLAGGVSWAGLSAVHGVDMLYPGSGRVDQAGHSLDVRLGLLKEFPDSRSFEAVVLRNQFAMTQGVTYLDQFWDPATQRVAFRLREERNLDETNTWGLHLQYSLPLAAGWRLGWLATGNRMSHPKIPNYEIMNIPRDPGNSDALDLGLGLSRRHGPAAFGVDLLFEPIWSHTWAEAAGPTPTATAGDTIPAGGMTVENRFRFSNALLRMGVSRDLPLAGLGRVAAFQLGLAVQSIRYRLTQDDHVQGSTRSLDESWVEWRPTWGLSLRFPEFELRYRGSVTHGTGRPRSSFGCTVCLDTPAGGVRGGIVVAPSGPMTLQDVRVVSHQLSLSLPLR